MGEARFDPASISRPDSALMRYYVIVSLLTMVGFPFVIVPLWFRYMTLRYRFDAEGVTMSVGLLFKKEVCLTYRRIQDIHVTRGIIQRWMGLATVAIQTASGSSSPEMTIEGVRNPDALRDYLYEKMRGAKGEAVPAGAAGPGAAPHEPADEALLLLRRIAESMERLAAQRGARS